MKCEHCGYDGNWITTHWNQCPNKGKQEKINSDLTRIEALKTDSLAHMLDISYETAKIIQDLITKCFDNKEEY